MGAIGEFKTLKSHHRPFGVHFQICVVFQPFHFSKMQLSEESFAILSILCLLSPDRGGNMCLRDRQQLNRLQVSSYLLEFLIIFASDLL